MNYKNCVKFVHLLDWTKSEKENSFIRKRININKLITTF